METSVINDANINITKLHLFYSCIITIVLSGHDMIGAGTGAEASFISGIAKKEDDLIAILDIVTLLG